MIAVTAKMLQISAQGEGKMPKKIPMRTCIGCGTSKPKKKAVKRKALSRAFRTQVPEGTAEQLTEQLGGADAG